MEKLTIEALDIRYGNLSRPEFYKENKDLIGQPVLGYNFGNCKVFTFEEYIDPLNKEKLLKLCALDQDPGEEYDLAKALSLESVTDNTVIQLAILPLCFRIDSKISSFEEGQEVVMVNNVEQSYRNTPMISQRSPATLNVEFGKIKRIIPHKAIKVELADIPGQIQVVRQPVLLGPKFEVIPLLQ